MIYCNNKNMYSCIYDILIDNKLINNIYYFWNNFDSIYNNYNNYNYNKIRAKKNWYRLKIRYNASKIIINKFDKNNYLKFIYFNNNININNLTDNDWEIVFK